MKVVSTRPCPGFTDAPPGQCVIGWTPQNYGERLTVPAALDRQGIRAALAVDGPTDSAVFLTFLQRVMCPRLRPGEVAALDNLRAHSVPGVGRSVGGCGCEPSLPASVLSRLQPD